MIGDPADFAIEHPDVLRALGRPHAHELLDGQREGMLLVHRRDIVQPIEIGHGLQVGLVLDQLFRTAMQEADVRIGPLDDLAIHLEH